MQLSITTATKKIQSLSKRIRAVSGGTGASKTVSILFTLCQQAQQNPGILISVVSESLPHLKRGAIRNFKDIMGPRLITDHWNQTDFVYTFSNKAQIEFFSVDQESKVRGARRDILFINEANNIHYETYNQLEVRTRKTIWLDWNPVSEFWYYTDVQPYNDTDFLTLTYKDNEMIEPEIIQSIESRKHNKQWYQVYALGQLGESQGRIYTGWKTINGIPSEARLIRYGLDFGYTNDPTAIIGIWRFNDWIIVDEIAYKHKLFNKQIANIFLGIPKALVRADSSEPKSIDEIRGYGVSIVGSAKGAGSVLAGIQYIQGLKVAATKRSTNLIKEYRNYLWMTDNNGKILNEPSGIWNHCMDALRYGLDDLRTTEIQKGGAVRIQDKTKQVPQWTVSPVGAIKGPDFISGFKQALTQRKSTAGIEFHK